MAIKFKMPKFGRNLTVKGWLKELLMTFLGTTISIVLTFGSATWVERKEADKARRLLAMTIISDIDQSLEVVTKRRLAEERGHETACYIIENKDRLESIPEDTLQMFIDYVTSSSFNSDMEFKTMNENIFISSQDTWRTLNDRKFLNNVQEFYNARAVLEQQWKEWICFKKPVTKEEEYELFMGGQCKSTADLCRKLLECKRLDSYMDFVSSRMMAYLGFLRLINLNEENKFLMNITEQDMEEFVNQTYMEINPAKEKALVGTWNAVVHDKKNELVYEFRRDHTFAMHQFTCVGTAFFRHKMVQRYWLSGTWGVEGYSLVMHYDMKSYKLDVDDSEISYPAHFADSVRAVKALLEGEMLKPRLVKKLDQNNRTAQATNIDKSGTRMELTDSDKNTIHYQRKINQK
ncbi:MAG: hypothetical protein IKD75_15385 [Prevotella sp.]|nr:hypothetical protein [Prevotella sp.]